MARKEKSYFNTNLAKRCEYCIHGTLSSVGTSVLCRNSGMVDLDNPPCRKYVYDPLRRIPEAQKEKRKIYADVIAEKEAQRKAQAEKFGYKLDDEEI